MQPPETNVTLEQVRRREPAVIAELVREHHRQLRGYVAAISADVGAVDDIAQEVFVRALERLDRVADLEDFGRFLRGIARNVVREHVRWQSRHRKRYVAFVDQAFESPADTEPAGWAGCPSVMEALRRCVEKLPDRSRQMLRLRYWEEKRSAEIGLHLGMNAGAVRIALLRIRETLIRCLGSRREHLLSEDQP